MKNVSIPIISMAVIMLMAVEPTPSHAQEKKFPKTITVNGSVNFVTPKEKNNIVWLYKDEMAGKAKAIDSARVNKENKSFHFVIHQDHPGIYHIEAMHWDQVSFWSNADVKVHLRGYDTAKIHMKIPHYSFAEGSMANNFINLYEQIHQLNYLRFVDEYNQKYYAKKHKEVDSTWVTYLNTKKRYDSIGVDLKKRMNVLMHIYKDQPVTLYALRHGIGPEDSEGYNHTLELLDRLIQKYPWLTEAKEAKNTIITNREMALKVEPGKILPTVSYPDNKGKLQGLEKYKGKYLLIDFWASWCGPCRAAIPKVKKLYAQYHPKELNVVSISIDDSKAAWEKAMKEESMTWEQLLSPNKEKTMKEFQFSGIPTIYLIDPAGKIIQSYTGYSPEAEAAIKNILKKHITAPKKKKVIRAASF